MKKRAGMKQVSSGVAIASFFALAVQAHGQSPLPKEIQADMLVGRIEAALAAGNAQDALIGLADYRKLDVKMSPALLFLEARLTAITKDYARSKKAFAEYLALSEVRTDKNYATALSLYADLEKAIDSNVKEQCQASVEVSTSRVATRQRGTVFRECPFAPEMVIVPAGSFLMGALPSADNHPTASDTGPQRQVGLRAFAASKYEVTFDEWDICVFAGGCYAYRPPDKSGRGRHPVVNVSWDDAQTYVSWLSQVTQKTYRLLTEAEWEYSARSGGENYNYKITGLEGIYVSKEVENGIVNKFGISNMSDNVAEWTEDCFINLYESSRPDGKPSTYDRCPERVIRGPSDIGVTLNFSSRRYAHPATRDIGLGFRIARTLN